MSKIKCQIKSKALIFKFLALNFDIHLTFACLPQAGILEFGIEAIHWYFSSNIGVFFVTLPSASVGTNSTFDRTR